MRPPLPANSTMRVGDALPLVVGDPRKSSGSFVAQVVRANVRMAARDWGYAPVIASDELA